MARELDCCKAERRNIEECDECRTATELIVVFAGEKRLLGLGRKA